MVWCALLMKMARGLLLPMVLLAVWQAASMRSVLVPSIGEVIEILLHPLQEPPNLDAISLGRSALISLLRVLISFTLAALTGIPLGLWVGRCRTAHEIFSPFISAMMVISPVAWLPVTILVFGLGSPASVLYGDDAWRFGMLDQLRFAIIFVIWMAAFFPIFVNTASGAHHVRDAHLEAVRVLGACRRQVLTKVILPGAAPSILTGLRIGCTIAWRALIAAELFPGTRGGLGYTIAAAQSQAVYAYAFASILLIAVIGLLLDGSLKWMVARHQHWQSKERS